ncbi:MAG: tetratricopeptide repeat protein, partial [Cloacibacillus porcorum]|nr:tetratricopeptide repeat protein [Cloacibacillus porcorum]
MKNEENIDGENIKCPDIVPEDQKGMTEEELEWSVKNPPRPKVPRYVFIALALILLVAFGGGSWWYYRKNVLPEKYYLRATTLMKDKQYARAEELYRRIMKIRPERRDVLYNIAYCKEETGETAEAIKYYEEHLKTAKNDTKAMTCLGWLYMKGGNYEQALKWL